MPRVLLLLSSILFSLCLSADPWRKVLLPIYFEEEVPGAFGSRWVMELHGFNPAGTHQRLSSEPERVCNTPSQCGDFIAPGEFFDARRFLGTDRPGQPLFAYINTAVTGLDLSDHLTLSLRTRDVSREAEGFGTTIPVVREEDTFRDRWPIALPAIPAGPLYRQKLRVYDFDGERGRNVVVEVYDGFTRIASRTLTFPLATSGYPGYAQLDLDTLPELVGRERVNVVVRTPQEGRFWGFVSVTNNASQQVTTVVP